MVTIQLEDKGQKCMVHIGRPSVGGSSIHVDHISYYEPSTLPLGNGNGKECAHKTSMRSLTLSPLVAA
jgi:hypothetical protein